ncbi:MAG: hypothetical protein AAGF54_04955 [Pseudomonadota bacterium]
MSTHNKKDNDHREVSLLGYIFVKNRMTGVFLFASIFYLFFEIWAISVGSKPGEIIWLYIGSFTGCTVLYVIFVISDKICNASKKNKPKIDWDRIYQSEEHKQANKRFKWRVYPALLFFLLLGIAAALAGLRLGYAAWLVCLGGCLVIDRGMRFLDYELADLISLELQKAKHQSS